MKSEFTFIICFIIGVLIIVSNDKHWYFGFILLSSSIVGLIISFNFYLKKRKQEVYGIESPSHSFSNVEVEN
jgi:presenilin-like A22 family membrane protease